MVLSFRWGNVAALWTAMGVLIIILVMLVLWPKGLGVVILPRETLRTIVVSLVFAAVPLLAAYAAAYELEQKAWGVSAKLGTAVLAAFLSTSAAVCVAVIAHIAMGGEWL
jgi:hypothetical protein